jgi:hypothetical protein
MYNPQKNECLWFTHTKHEVALQCLGHVQSLIS